MSTDYYYVLHVLFLACGAHRECCPPAPNRILVQSSQKSFILQVGYSDVSASRGGLAFGVLCMLGC